MTGRRLAKRAGFWFSVFVIVSPAIFVFLWMLSLSLKNEIDNIAYPPVFIPDPPTFANFISVFQQNNIGRYLWNSIVVSGGATLIALLIGVPAGYGIARTGAHRFTVLILIARMTPALYHLIPQWDGAVITDHFEWHDLFDVETWQPSVLQTIAEHIRLAGKDPSLSEAKRIDAAREILRVMLEQARAHRETVDEFTLAKAGLVPTDWLCLVGLGEKRAPS